MKIKYIKNIEEFKKEIKNILKDKKTFAILEERKKGKLIKRIPLIITKK